MDSQRAFDQPKQVRRSYMSKGGGVKLDHVIRPLQKHDVVIIELAGRWR